MLQILLTALVTCCALTECVSQADKDGVVDPLQILDDDQTAIHRTRRLIFGGMFSDKSDKNSFKYENVKRTVGGKLTILGIPLGLSVTYGSTGGKKPQPGQKIENLKQVTKVENQSAGAKGKFFGLGLGAEFNMQVSKKETQGDTAPSNPVVMLPPPNLTSAQRPVASGAGTGEVTGPPSGKAISAIQPLENNSLIGARSYPLTHYEKIQKPDTTFRLPFTSRNESSETLDSKVNNNNNNNNNPNFSLPFTSMNTFSKTQNSLNVNAKDFNYTPTRIRNKVHRAQYLNSNGNWGQSRRKRSYILKYTFLSPPSFPSVIPTEVPYYRVVPSYLDYPIHLTRLGEKPINTRVSWSPTLGQQSSFSNLEWNLENKARSVMEHVYDRLRNPFSSQNEPSPRSRSVWFDDFRPALKETLAGVQKELQMNKQNKEFNDINIISTFKEGDDIVPYFTTISWRSTQA